MELEYRTSWRCPEEADARVLGGPNIVKPLMKCAPRVYMGQAAWDKLRKRTYFLADYKCQICGKDCSTPGTLDAHELYTVNYMDGTAVFARVFALCKACHSFYHSGRLLTLHKQGSPLYSAKHVLNVLEHGFKLIHDWNVAHPDKPKLKAYGAILDGLKQEDLREPLTELIKEYDMEFWEEDPKRLAKWKDWKLVYGRQIIRTPYASPKEWEEAMAEASKTDSERQPNPFSGGVFDEINDLLKDEN